MSLIKNILKTEDVYKFCVKIKYQDFVKLKKDGIFRLKNEYTDRKINEDIRLDSFRMQTIISRDILNDYKNILIDTEDNFDCIILTLKDTDFIYKNEDVRIIGSAYFVNNFHLIFAIEKLVDEHILLDKEILLKFI